MANFLKQKTKAISVFIIPVIFFVSVLSFGFYPQVAGQSTDELTQLRQEKQKKLEEITKKISQLQDEIKQRKSIASSLKNEIAILNLEIQETEAQIESTNAKIDATNLDIAETTERIIKTEYDIYKQKQVLKELISEIYDMDQRSPLEIALENDNFTQFLDQIQYATNLQERSQEVLSEIKILKTELELKNVELKRQKSELDALKEQLDIAQAGLVDQRKSKQQILDKTRGQERTYQKLLAESENLEDQIQKEIFDLEVELRNRMGDRRLPSIKGLLAWPMDGVLTQGYGNTGFTKLGYTYHNGIDIAGPAGMQIYAAADGVVINTGTGNGAYGNWISIKHKIQTSSGERALITLYAHMSSFKVKVGQEVKMGDLIGFEGNTGNTTRLLYGPHRGYHLHFTIFDAEGYGVVQGKYTNVYGNYMVPFGYTYNPLEFL